VATRRSKPATIIAVANQKGGVAKTTSVASLGAAFVEQGKRVLLVDLDAQACLTFSLGVDPDEVDKSVNEVLLGHASVADVRVACDDGVDLVPSVIDLAGAEAQLLPRPGREYILKGVLEEVREDYDVILLDCSPSLGVLTLNALTAAQGLVIPMPCEMLSHRGVGQLLDTVADAATTRRRSLQTSVSATACRSSHRRSPRPCASRRHRRWGARSWPPHAPRRGRRPTARWRRPWPDSSEGAVVGSWA
jgi:chromosome partitioning protein